MSFRPLDARVRKALTFDDVLLLPSYSDFLPAEAELGTQLTRKLRLKIPLLSAAMDTVTESKVATVMARMGGLGVIHKNLTPEAQASEVQKVKAFSLTNAEREHAAVDSQGRLLVGAAVGVAGDRRVRVQKLVEAGLDVLIIDTAHAHSKGVIDALAETKDAHAELQVIAGNVATARGTRLVLAAGADGVKVGVGPGSICTTRIVAGVGVPQLTAISDCATVAMEAGVPIIADGGVRHSGDIVKAIAAGASAVMIGGLFAGTDESPGELKELDGQKVKTYRGMGSFGAMRAGSKDRYGQAETANDKLVAEGVTATVPYRGPLGDIVFQLLGGLRSGMGYTGCRTIDKLQTDAEFVQQSSAGLRESHVHDVTESS